MSFEQSLSCGFEFYIISQKCTFINLILLVFTGFLYYMYVMSCNEVVVE